MGDCGALVLGVLMAASTMSLGSSTDATFSGQSFFFLAPLFIPLVIPRGVPVLDTLFAIVRRAGPALRRRHRRQGPPAPPAAHAGARAAPGGLHPVGLDGAALRCRAVPGADRAGRRAGAAGHGGAGPLAVTIFHPGARRARVRTAAVQRPRPTLAKVRRRATTGSKPWICSGELPLGSRLRKSFTSTGPADRR